MPAWPFPSSCAAFFFAMTILASLVPFDASCPPRRPEATGVSRLVIGMPVGGCRPYGIMRSWVTPKFERGQLVEVADGGRASRREVPAPRTVATRVQRARTCDGDARRRAARRTPALHLHRLVQPRRVLRGAADRSDRGDAQRQDRTGRDQLPRDPRARPSPRPSPVRALQRGGDAGARAGAAWWSCAIRTATPPSANGCATTCTAKSGRCCRRSASTRRTPSRRSSTSR